MLYVIYFQTMGAISAFVEYAKQKNDNKKGKRDMYGIGNN